ncbi:type I phosphomannose isomerase catalytic subunit [Mycoplasma sp. 5370]
MEQIIFLKPYFKKTLWANDKIKKIFNLKENIGEAWLISAIKDCETILSKTNQKFSDFIKENPLFFGLDKNEVKTFIYPNLTKFLDAKYPLSIQVHPDDEYAKKFNSLGKNECWYVLENTGKPFILGSTTTEKKVFEKVINSKETEKYLNKVELKKGDFVFIESGLIHGIPEKTMVFELQQSSDITYRLYDYERIDTDGKKREIHIKESLETMKLDLQAIIQKQLNQEGFYNAKNFNLTKKEINNTTEIIDTTKAKYCTEVVVFEGEGFLNKITKIKQGDVFIVSKQTLNFSISGNIKIFINFV